MMNPKAATMIGFAKRSGNLASGFTAVSIQLKKGKAKLVVLSEDIAEDSKRKLVNLCKATGTPCCFHGSRDDLGHAIGRDATTAIAIMESKFAKIVEENIQ
jgi:ribosomal protein L7Ae-like RNA K-turn-binding protein